MSSDGRVYIADNTSHSIWCWSPHSNALDRTVSDESNPTFKFPTVVRILGDKMVVVDSFGVRVFGSDWKLENSARLTQRVVDLDVGPKGSYFGSPLLRNPSVSDPLLVQMDELGQYVKGFGRRLPSPDHNYLNDLAYVAVTELRLFAAFKHRAIVQIYNINTGSLVIEVPVFHPIFGALEDLADDPAFRDSRPGAIALPRILAGIRVRPGRVFILLHLPHIEIVELDTEGRQRSRYRHQLSQPIIEYTGFDIEDGKGDPRFFIACIDSTRSVNLLELAVANSDPNERENRYEE